MPCLLFESFGFSNSWKVAFDHKIVTGHSDSDDLPIHYLIDFMGNLWVQHLKPNPDTKPDA